MGRSIQRATAWGNPSSACFFPKLQCNGIHTPNRVEFTERRREDPPWRVDLLFPISAPVCLSLHLSLLSLLILMFTYSLWSISPFLSTVHPSLCIIFRYVSRLNPQAAQASSAIYKDELDSVNCLKMVQNRKIKITYLIVVVFLCVLGVSGAFQAIFEFCSYTFQRSKFKNLLKRPRNIQNA